VEIVRKHIEGLGLEDICSSVTTAANPYFPPIAEPLRPSPDYVKAVLESWQEQQAERKPWMRQT
jgi:hypothetical protein